MKLMCSIRVRLLSYIINSYVHLDFENGIWSFSYFHFVSFSLSNIFLYFFITIITISLFFSPSRKFNFKIQTIIRKRDRYYFKMEIDREERRTQTHKVAPKSSPNRTVSKDPTNLFFLIESQIKVPESLGKRRPRRRACRPSRFTASTHKVVGRRVCEYASRATHQTWILFPRYTLPSSLNPKSVPTREFKRLEIWISESKRAALKRSIVCLFPVFFSPHASRRDRAPVQSKCEF